MLLLSFVFVGVAVLWAGLAIPLIARRVPQKEWYSLFLSKPCPDDIWYDANAAWGRDIVILSSCIVVAATVMPVLGLSEHDAATVLFAIAFGGLATTVVIRWRRVKRLRRERAKGRKNSA